MRQWWRGWRWRLAVGVAVAVVAALAGWSAIAGGQPIWLVSLGTVATVLGGFGPLLFDWLAGWRAKRRAAIRAGAAWQVAEPDESVVWLLRPANRVVPFAGRLEQLKKLTAWCDQDQAMPVRLVVAPGGFGKTRLVGEFAARRKRWQVWPVKEDSEAQVAAAILDDRVEKRLLVIVDYAEARAARQLAGLVAAVARQDRRDDARVRLLLIARRVGPWWTQLGRFAEGDQALVESVIVAPGGVIELPAHADDRPPETIMGEAAKAFAAKLRQPLPASMPTPRHPEGLSLLQLHAYALTAVLGSAPSTVDTRADVIDEVLRHEARYWRRRATSTHPPLIGAADPDEATDADLPLWQLTAVACLFGAANNAEALELVHRTPCLAAIADQAIKQRWARWLAALYPDTQQPESLGLLQPDLLAEHLIAQLLTACDLQQIRTMFAGIDPREAVQALTVIGRASDHHPHLLILVDVVLGASLASMTHGVITVASQFPRLYTARLVAQLPGDIAPEQLTELARLVPYPSLELAQVAVALTTAITAQKDLDRAGRAGWLTTHAVRLGEVGRRAEGLAAAEEA
ncbi:hypothetical protein, partial [Rhizocola hellebori]|uniref:hypothetical protein n=1 Tax=Rhizocola hellebori TaxID=1392758 RepID=UPI0019459C52